MSEKIRAGQLYLYRTRRYPFPRATVVLSVSQSSMKSPTCSQNWVDLVVLNLYDLGGQNVKFEIKTYKRMVESLGFAGGELVTVENENVLCG